MATEQPTWKSEVVRLKNVTKKVFNQMDANLWVYPFDSSKHPAPVIYDTNFEIGYPTCFLVVLGITQGADKQATLYLQTFSEIRKAAYEVFPGPPPELDLFVILMLGLPDPHLNSVVPLDKMVATLAGWELLVDSDGTSHWVYNGKVGALDTNRE